MALRFYTGFDYINTSQIGRVFQYNQNGLSLTPGRYAGRGWVWDNQPGFIATSIPAASTVVTGFAFSFAYGDATNPFLIFLDATSSTSSPLTQVDLRVTADAAIQVTRNGTILDTTAAGVFQFGLWNYMEVKTFINDSTGYIQIKINGATVLNSASKDTKNTGNNYVNMVRWQAFSSTGAFNFRLDDIYILDDTGATNNDFRGECRVKTLYPTANGETNQFSRVGAASNWQAVSEIISDDDTSYVLSSVLGHVDDYDMETLALTGSIYGLQLNVTHRKDDVGSRSIAPVISSSSIYYEGSIFSCMSDYTIAQKIWELNPATTSAWTNSTINSLYAGLVIKG